MATGTSGMQCSQCLDFVSKHGLSQSSLISICLYWQRSPAQFALATRHVHDRTLNAVLGFFLAALVTTLKVARSKSTLVHAQSAKKMLVISGSMNRTIGPTRRIVKVKVKVKGVTMIIKGPDNWFTSVIGNFPWFYGVKLTCCGDSHSRTSVTRMGNDSMCRALRMATQDKVQHFLYRLPEGLVKTLGLRRPWSVSSRCGQGDATATKFNLISPDMHACRQAHTQTHTQTWRCTVSVQVYK
jgi:hypothetical protein